MPSSDSDIFANAAVPPAPRPAAARQQPAIGRIVLYRPTPHDREGRGGSAFYPAVVTRVWSDSCVNLQVLADDGAPFCVTSVNLADRVATIVPSDRTWS